MKTLSHSIPHSLCLLLLTLLTALALPGLAVAKNEVGYTNDGRLKYRLYDDCTAMVSGYYGDYDYRPSGDLVIPAKVTYEGKTYKVTSIRSSDAWNDGAFYDCSGLTSVTFPEGLTSIGARAFYGCSGLTSLTLPEGLTSIGDEAFYGCSGLTSLTLPEGLTSIGDEAFWSCKRLTSVTLPEGLTSIGDYAFAYCSGLTSLTLPEGLTSIGNDAFYKCSGLTSVTFPEGLTSIGKEAFYKCSGLTSVTLPQGLTSIGNFAFYDCSGLTSVTFPEGLTSIGARAFYHCSGLTILTLSEGLTSIGEGAFYGCSGLTNVTFPEGLTSIGYSAFSGCSGLTSVYCLSKDPSGYDSYAFYADLYVPASAVAAYQYKFSRVEPIPTTSLPISSAQFGTCYTSQESFLIPEGLEGGIVTAAEAKDGSTLQVDWRFKAGDYVPTGVPLVLKGEEGTYVRYRLPANGLSVDRSGLDQNLLRGSDEDATTTAADGVNDAVFYKLAFNNDRTQVGFYWGAEDGGAFVNPAGKAYLALPRAEYAHVKRLILDGNAVTGIDSAPTTDSTAPAAQSIYTLDGRKVNAATTKGLPAGLYIVDGRKVLVK